MTWKLRIEFESAAHHGSGYGRAGIIDHLLLRDHEGMPYLAGSAVKGKLRHAGRRLLATCPAEGEKPACQTTDVQFPCEQEPCLICRVFGSPLLQGSVVFSDAYPEGPELTALFLALDGPAKPTLGGAEGCTPLLRLIADAGLRASTICLRRRPFHRWSALNAH